MLEENVAAAKKQSAPPVKKRASYNGVTPGREAFHIFLAAIPVIGFMIFGLVPLVLSLALSFTDVKMSILEDFTFVGVKNFITLAKNVYFKKSIVNTLHYTLNVPLSIALGLFIAYLVNKAMKGKYFFRSVFFIPYVCSTVSVAVAWKIMYDKQYAAFFVRRGADRLDFYAADVYAFHDYHERVERHGLLRDFVSGGACQREYGVLRIGGNRRRKQRARVFFHFAARRFAYNFLSFNDEADRFAAGNGGAGYSFRREFHHGRSELGGYDGSEVFV